MILKLCHTINICPVQTVLSSSPMLLISLTYSTLYGSVQALGVEVDIGPQSVARCVEEAGVGFMYAPR